MNTGANTPRQTFQRKLFVIIFQSDTPAGWLFDLVLIAFILASVLTVILESVEGIRDQYGNTLQTLEWVFTIVFTIEYGLRLYCVPRPVQYAWSFFGIIDLLAIAPTYLSLLLPGAQALLVIRILRVLRVFRVLKLTQYLEESRVLTSALYASRRKIGVFLFAVLTLLTIIGALMYLIEGPEHGFSDIPTSMYWAVVTLTTVGYGDVSPATPLGRTLASFVMVLGYSIIAVPTGIVTSELTRSISIQPSPPTPGPCPGCGAPGHDYDAQFCKHCGIALRGESAETVA